MRLDTLFQDLVLFAATRNLRKSVSLFFRRRVECTDTPQRSLRGPPATKNGELVDQMATHLPAGTFPRCQRIQQFDADGI